MLFLSQCSWTDEWAHVDKHSEYQFLPDFFFLFKIKFLMNKNFFFSLTILTFTLLILLTLQFTTLLTILVFTLLTILTKIFRLLTLQYYTKHHLHYNTKHNLQSELTCLLRLAVLTLQKKKKTDTLVTFF